MNFDILEVVVAARIRLQPRWDEADREVPGSRPPDYWRRHSAAVRARARGAREPYGERDNSPLSPTEGIPPEQTSSREVAAEVFRLWPTRERLGCDAADAGKLAAAPSQEGAGPASAPPPSVPEDCQ